MKQILCFCCKKSKPPETNNNTTTGECLSVHFDKPLNDNCLGDIENISNESNTRDGLKLTVTDFSGHLPVTRTLSGTSMKSIKSFYSVKSITSTGDFYSICSADSIESTNDLYKDANM